LETYNNNCERERRSENKKAPAMHVAFRSSEGTFSLVRCAAKN